MISSHVRFPLAEAGSGQPEPPGHPYVALFLWIALVILISVSPSLACSESLYRPALRTAIEASNVASSRLDLARASYEASARRSAIESVARCEQAAAGDAAKVGPCLEREQASFLARYQPAWEALSRAWVAQTTLAAALEAALKCDRERDTCESGSCREQRDACVRASLDSATIAAEALSKHVARAEETVK